MLKKCWLKVLALLFFLSTGVFAAPYARIVADDDDPVTKDVTLITPLNVFKDPIRFLRNIGLLRVDPQEAWKNMEEGDFFLTTLSPGKHTLAIWKSQTFRNFVTVAELMQQYEKVEPRLGHKGGKASLAATRINRVMILNGGYSGSPGFVLSEDLEQGQRERLTQGQLPPSIGVDDKKISELTRQLKSSEEQEHRN